MNRPVKKEEIIKIIYPNPTKDYCNIVFYKRGKYKIDIFDLKRQLIKTVNTSDEQINIILTEFNPGTYVTIFTNLETGLISNSKFIIQR